MTMTEDRGGYVPQESAPRTPPTGRNSDALEWVRKVPLSDGSILHMETRFFATKAEVVSWVRAHHGFEGALGLPMMLDPAEASWEVGNVTFTYEPGVELHRVTKTVCGDYDGDTGRPRHGNAMGTAPVPYGRSTWRDRLSRFLARIGL